MGALVAYGGNMGITGVCTRYVRQGLFRVYMWYLCRFTSRGPPNTQIFFIRFWVG